MWEKKERGGRLGQARRGRGRRGLGGIESARARARAQPPALRGMLTMGIVCVVGGGVGVFLGLPNWGAAAAPLNTGGGREKRGVGARAGGKKRARLLRSLAGVVCVCIAAPMVQGKAAATVESCGLGRRAIVGGWWWWWGGGWVPGLFGVRVPRHQRARKTERDKIACCVCVWALRMGAAHWSFSCVWLCVQWQCALEERESTLSLSCVWSLALEGKKNPGRSLSCCSWCVGRRKARSPQGGGDSPLVYLISTCPGRRHRRTA